MGGMGLEAFPPIHPWDQKPLLATFGMPMTTQPYQATEERKHLTTGGPGKEQGTNKLPATRILQRSTRGQQEAAPFVSGMVRSLFEPRAGYRGSFPTNTV